MAYEKLTISQTQNDFQAGKLKPTALVKFYLAEIQKINPDLNIYLEVLKEESLRQAEESEKRYQAGKPKGPLDGMPIALKDNISTKNVLTTASSKILENYRPPYDATVVEKLREAGAIILGKTNLDEFAMGSSTETSFFGPTKNPYDLTRVPGGSSGGSAAAIASNLALVALGSDTGGSIRQPASFCGIVGFKPTYGAVSRYGLLAMASSLDQIGPMTKTVRDAEILFGVISGADPKDSTSININQNAKCKSQNDISKCKIGVPKEYFGQGLEPAVRKIIKKAIDQLKSLGAKIQEISLPNSKYALSCYYIIMPVEVSSNLARYDGLKYGYSATQNSKLKTQNLLEVYLKTRSDGFGVEAKRRIMLGTYASSAGYIDKYYNQAQKVRTLIKKDFDKAFSEVDFILGPVSPEKAFKIGQKSDPLTMYLSDIYTIAVNLAGLPAISVPAGMVDDLPVGLQIIGPQFSDWQIFKLAKVFERIRGELSYPEIS